MQCDRLFRDLLAQGIAFLRPRLAAQAVALNGVVAGGDLLLRLGKRFSRACKPRLRITSARGGCLTVRGHLRASFFALGKGIRNRSEVGISCGKLASQTLLPVAQLEIVFCHAVRRIREALALCLRVLELFGELLRLLPDLCNTPFQCGNLLRNAAASRILLGKLGLDAGDIGKAVFAVRTQHGDFTLHGLRLRVRPGDLLPQTVNLHIAVVQVKGEGLRRHIELIQGSMLLLEDKGGGMIVLLRLARRSAQLFERFQPQGDLKALQLVTVGEKFFCLFRLLPQRLDL